MPFIGRTKLLFQLRDVVAFSDLNVVSLLALFVPGHKLVIMMAACKLEPGEPKHRARQARTAARSSDGKQTHAMGSETLADIAMQVKHGETSSWKQESILAEYAEA